MPLKGWIDLAKAVVLPAIVLVIVISDYSGFFDYVEGLTEAQKVSDRFNLSYAANASHPIYPTDSAWMPVLRLIRKFSNVELRSDKMPETIARMQSILSANEPNTNFEWTSPSTPIVVMYRHWPGDTETPLMMGEDATIVGTIGDLQRWIGRARDTRRFWIHDLLFGILAIFISYWGWHLNHVKSKN